MTRIAATLTVPAICLGLAAGCSDPAGPDGSSAERNAAGPAPMSILVDASRDGGVWWFPQEWPFDPESAHQGRALASYLRGKGFRVDELGRPTTITPGVLQ